MIGTNFTDDLDCGFFDQIDDLLDFPNEDVDAGLSAAEFASFPSIWTDQPESLPGSGSGSVFSNNSNSDLSAEISVPYDEIVQLEWLSNFVDDSFSGGSLTMMSNKKAETDSNSSQNRFQSSSPVSVLESSSSCVTEKAETETAGPQSSETVAAAAPGKCGRARSKRPRPATFSPRPNQLISSNSSVNENLPPPKIPSDSENHAESRLLIKIPKEFNPEHKKKKKMKSAAAAAIPSSSPPEEQNQNAPTQSIRKCMHCEITKTPQWRAGPMGPKTLCNACGVRYKSGRLFPEYRPAASPTFVPSVHSNSHKKVVEMRNKSIYSSGFVDDNLPELIPNDTNPAIDYI